MLLQQYSKQTREVATVDLADVPDHLVAINSNYPGTPAFQFNRWMAFLDPRERDALTLRFIEGWEYHEIAAAQPLFAR